MDDPYYLYAFTWAHGPYQPLGPGVDPRFPVELVRCTQVAALASRVGFDQFHLDRLQGDNPDVPWLSRVAIRHNQIIAEAAQRSPVLPLHLGVLFTSRGSLLAKLTHCESAVADFLRNLEHRQEWSAKIYLERDLAEKRLEPAGAGVSGRAGAGGTGAQYLAQRRSEHQRQRAAKQQLEQEIATVETSLTRRADQCRRLRTLSADLTGRNEKMVWNAAFLLPRPATEAWLEIAEAIRRAVARRGLLLEIGGPWPPYHFCPVLEMDRNR